MDAGPKYRARLQHDAVPKQPDLVIKALLIGDSGVGKSSILLRFTENEFHDDQLATIGVDFKTKTVFLGERSVKLFIWDTAGQERFRTLASSYYRGAQGVVLVYDCTVRKSFDNLPYWLGEVERHCTSPDIIKLLVSNKIDRNKVEVTREEGEQFAFDHDMLFIETSAKTKEGIQHAFEELVMKILESPSVMGSQAHRNADSLTSTRDGGGRGGGCCGD